MKPITAPTTGTTKKPTAPATPPTYKVRQGTPDSDIRRAGSSHLSTWLISSTAVAPISTHQASPDLSVSAHHSTPAQTTGGPGTPGTRTPNRPSTITSPTATNCQVPMGSRVPEDVRPRRPA